MYIIEMFIDFIDRSFKKVSYDIDDIQAKIFADFFLSIISIILMSSWILMRIDINKTSFNNRIFTQQVTPMFHEENSHRPEYSFVSAVV